jgi:hypothetical protein
MSVAALLLQVVKEPSLPASGGVTAVTATELLALHPFGAVAVTV